MLNGLVFSNQCRGRTLGEMLRWPTTKSNISFYTLLLCSNCLSILHLRREKARSSTRKALVYARHYCVIHFGEWTCGVLDRTSIELLIWTGWLSLRVAPDTEHLNGRSGDNLGNDLVSESIPVDSDQDASASSSDIFRWALEATLRSASA